MKLSWIHALATTLGAVALVSVASAQQATVYSPSLVPVPKTGPQLTGYPSYPSTGARVWSSYPNEATAIENTSDSNAASSSVMSTNGGQAGDCGCDDGCGGSWFSKFRSRCGNGCGWYAGVGGIVMSRDRGNGIITTNDGTPFVPVINSRDVMRDWQGGWEVTLGKFINPNTAVEVNYWHTGLFHESDTQIATAQGSGNLDTPLNFGTLNDGVNNVQDLYATAAGAHMVGRANEFMNLEINLIRHSCCCDRPMTGSCGSDCGSSCGDCGSCCRPMCFSWFAGVRLFRFYENMLFATSDDNTDFVFDANEAYYDVRVHNNLIGGQIGGRVDYYMLGGKVGLWFAPRLGIYGNHISHESFLRTGNGELFDIHSYKNDVAFMGQLDVGGDYYITDNLKLYGGYRLVGVAGVALSDEQIPQNIQDSAAIADVDSNGSLLLHGAFMGLEYRF
ncbi:MAG: hypothetical protein WD875_15085 [Pirellulales bacterium]